jgi:hypothetical protein
MVGGEGEVEGVEGVERSAGGFELPVLFANPKNDDEFFFNYRLKQFAPETEPLIKATFGEGLVFEEGGFWEHTSYTSHVVGFATNLPALSVVEYGKTTAYGERTRQSEAYYYQHLHYLKGLEAEATYHYRILVCDDEGHLQASGDHTFRLRRMTGELIRIPEDIRTGAPYELSVDNATYVLTQDLSVPTLAINIRAHNVELDLDGHTIVYDEGEPVVPEADIYDEGTSYGIRAGLWNFTNFRILNGTIRQGRTGGAGLSPLFLNHMGSASYNEIAGLTVDYYGANTVGMATGNGHVHHNVLYDRGSAVGDRHMGVRAISRSSDYWNTRAIFSYNSLRRFRQIGIGEVSGKVEHNELYCDSFVTNSFCISAGQDVEVRGNKIFGMGYLPIGIGWGNNIEVRNNFIYLRGYAPAHRSDEYGRKSSVAGMRITDGNVRNLLYEDNTIVLKAEDGCTLARGIWSFNAENNKNIVYRRNTVKVEAMPGNLKNPEKGPTIVGSNPSAYYNDDVNYALAAVTFSARAENAPEGSAMPSPVIFEDNHLIGNVNLVVIGEGYGICNSVWMYRTKLEKIEHDSEFFRPVRLGFWYWDTWNHRMVDTECIGIAERDMLPYFFGGTGKMEMRYGESKTLTVKDRNGRPLANKLIRLSTLDDDYTQELWTDESGRLAFDLLSVRHYKLGDSRQEGGSEGVVSKTDYGQYVFSVAGYAPCVMPLTQLKEKESITLVPAV